MKRSKIHMFNVLKLNTSFIMKHNSNITLEHEYAYNNSLIVSLGDNQLFNFIRRIKEQDKILEDIITTKRQIQAIENDNIKEDSLNRKRELQKQLEIMTFIPDIISIKADSTKKDYKSICKNFFKVSYEIHGVKYNYTYRRLCAGAGQLRRNSALFVNVDLYNQLESIMMCGLTKTKIGKINLAKFSAYFALYTSATRKVTTPNICVVKDFEYSLKDQLVDWVYEKDNGEMDVEEKLIDFDINAFDGSGIVSPKMAETWATDLSLDYLPSSFIVRSAWVKGLTSIFDFHELARRNNITEITDAWGNKVAIDEIDVILTASQFKMWKKYDSWQEYMYYFKRFKHIFSVARVNKKEDDGYTALNYQYIQTNNFTPETIKGLSNYSLDWVKNVMNRDHLYTLLYLDINNITDEVTEDTPIMDKLAKALSYCPDIMYDKYFTSRITRGLKDYVDRMKIGKLFVEGAYEFMIPDTYALAEHALGLEVKGLIPEGAVWNRRWVNKDTEKIVSMRSPLVDPSENRLLNVYNDNDCNYWYQYIQSGVIYNIWDMTAIAMSDADYDGDLCMSTDNKYLIDAVGSNKKVITYKKSKAKEQKLNTNSFAAMDTKSFNSKIGVITNIASNMIAMLSNYKENTREHKELKKRIKLLRFHQGSAILKQELVA